MYLKQSTSVDVPIGPFLDETDGKTAETALTITQPDIRLKKNNGNWAQKNAAQTLTHEENGWYEVTLDTTDTDTIGHLVVAIHESGALPVWREFHVLAANVYDSLFGAATDKLDVNVEEWNTTSVPAEHTAGYPIVTVKDGTGTGEINTNAGAIALVDLVTTTTTATNLTNLPAITANWLTAAGTAADFGAEIADAVTDEALSGHTTSGTVGWALAAAKDNTDYPDGYVYLDETAGVAGTTVGIHGTARSPANTWANANTIAVARNTKAVTAIPGGLITISSGTYDNYAINLNSGTMFLDDSVSLTSTWIYSTGKTGGMYETSVNNPVIIGQACFLENLNINGLRVTHAQVYVKNCGFYGNVTDGTGAPSATFRVYMANCYNAKGTGDVTFALASGGHWLLEGWYGNLTLTGMAAGQTFTVFGYGKLTIAASCTGGTLQHTSHIEILDQAGGAVTTDLISEPGTVSGFTTAAKAELQQEATDALQATIPDSIPADGTRPSIQQACYMICQGLFEGSISGTTWTIKKVDGTTTLFTETLDHAVTPTSRTRAT